PCSLFDKTKAPLDQSRVCKLKDHTFSDASCTSQGFGTVAGNPKRRCTGVGPSHFQNLAVVVDLLAAIQIPDHLHRLLEIFESAGLLAHDPAGTVAPPNSTTEAPSGYPIQRSQQARGNGWIANYRVCYTSSQSHAACIYSH